MVQTFSSPPSSPTSLSSWRLVPAQFSSFHPPPPAKFQPLCLLSYLHINQGFGIGEILGSSHLESNTILHNDVKGVLAVGTLPSL